MSADRYGGAPVASFPSVSLIVRSCDRPSLAEALASAAGQDYPALEVVIVAASGRAHRAPENHAGDHPIVFVASERPLSRPAAANAGLDAAHGDWLTFLDDDDVLLPGHIAGLIEASRNAGEARFVHTLARARMADGRIESFGQPFSLPQLHERNFIHLGTALFARSLALAGCRFDESLDIMEDWDFFLQCAQHTRFHFEPRQTFEWRAESGSSGAAGGANHDDRRFAAYRDRIHAKWATQRDALVDHVRAGLTVALEMARQGNVAGAETRCRGILASVQNDAHALNLLAMLQRKNGRLDEARRTQELACAVRPQDPSLVYNLALLCRLQGDRSAALRHCRKAAEVDPTFAPSQRLLAELRP